MSALGVHATASMAALPPLPRRHWMRISPQAFLCVSCFLFQLPPQHRIPWRILPIPQAPAVFDQHVDDVGAIRSMLYTLE